MPNPSEHITENFIDWQARQRAWREESELIMSDEPKSVFQKLKPAKNHARADPAHLHRESCRHHVNTMAQARPGNPTVAIRTRGQQADMLVVEEPAAFDADEHRGTR